jgi:hypothetical protein
MLDPPKMVIQPSRIETSAVNNGHNGHGLSKNRVFPGIPESYGNSGKFHEKIIIIHEFLVERSVARDHH